MNLKDKTIVLTGASSGIGLSLLRELIKEKSLRIIAVSRNIEYIPSYSSVYPISADLKKPEEIDKVFEYANKIFGSVDIFIANAGYAYMEKLETPNWEHNEQIFALNTLSPIYSLQKLISENSKKEIQFVYVSSAATKVAIPYYSLYTSTKSAINSFLDAFRFEAPKNLRISSVYPIATKTDFFNKAFQMRKPIVPFLTQDAEKVAKVIISGIKKNKLNIYPSFLFRMYFLIGKIFPFLFSFYSKNEKRKIEKFFFKAKPE